MKPRIAEPHEELLGVLLNDHNIIKEYKHLLTSRMFKQYAGLYEIITKDPDYSVILQRKYPEWAEAIEQLCQAAPRFYDSQIRGFIEIVRSEVLKEDIQDLCKTTYKKTDAKTANEVLRELQKKSMELQTSEFNGLHKPEEDFDEHMRYLEEIKEDPSKAFGLLTGIEDIDRITTGWHRVDFSVLGGRTSMGKSAFALDLILNLNDNGYKCAIFSLEMPKKQIYNRMICNRLGLELKSLRTGQVPREYYPKIKALKPLIQKIYIDDSRGVTSDYILDSMRKLKREQGLDFVLVDYLQDIVEPGESNDNTGSPLGRVCRKLRAGAQELDVHVMGLSQVTRAAENRDKNNKRPINSDLAGSTGIETSADVILFIYRDEYYNPETEKKNIAEIIFTKQRNGETGTVELAFMKKTQRFIALDRTHERRETG